MISFVRGVVVHAGTDQVVVDLGSVGLSVVCTPATALSLRTGDHVELVTSLVIREDAWTVYGFGDPDERTVFEQVQTVGGIGPRIALALLGTLTPDELRDAVATGDERALTAVPGIGRKGAQRLILELADRLGPAAGAKPATAPAGAPQAGWRQAVASGLASLGWSAREADAALDRLDPALVAQADQAQAAAGTVEVGALLKAALRGLDRA